MNLNNRCGNTDIQVSTSLKQIVVTNLPIADNTSCVWSLWDRVEGFQIFNGDRINLRIDSLVNMNLFIAAGYDLSSSSV